MLLKELRDLLIERLFTVFKKLWEFAPRHVFSQDFEDQVIPGQETKAESSHSPMDSNENW